MHFMRYLNITICMNHCKICPSQNAKSAWLAPEGAVLKQQCGLSGNSVKHHQLEEVRRPQWWHIATQHCLNQLYLTC